MVPLVKPTFSANSSLVNPLLCTVASTRALKMRKAVFFLSLDSKNPNVLQIHSRSVSYSMVGGFLTDNSTYSASDSSFSTGGYTPLVKLKSSCQLIINIVDLKYFFVDCGFIVGIFQPSSEKFLS